MQENKIKNINHTSFLNSSVFVSPVQIAHIAVKILPVGDRLENFGNSGTPKV